MISTRILFFDLLGQSMVKLQTYGRLLVPTHRSEIPTASETSAPLLTNSNGTWSQNSAYFSDLVGTRLADLIQQNEFQTLDLAAYGKNFMTSMGFSPDAFVQMAFQAAYYGLYGRVECTYEPAMTKVYLHGRTEAIRSVTPESVDFVQTFWG